MGGVRTPIIGSPRPLPTGRRASPLYTLICEEPDNAIGEMAAETPGDRCVNVHRLLSLT